MSFQLFVAKLIMKLPASWKIRLSGGKPLEIGGRTLDPSMQLLAHMGQRRPPLHTMGAEAAQNMAANTAAALMGRAKPGVSWRDDQITSRGEHKIPVRIYRSVNQDPSRPLLTYYHMGGGVVGDLNAAHQFCQLLCTGLQCPVVSVDYRLAPQNKFPAGLEDCLDAYEWCLRQAESLGAPAGRAAVGGDSMGGHFAAVVAQDMLREDKPVPDLQLLIYPATDMVTEFRSQEVYGTTYPLTMKDMDWFIDNYLSDPNVDRSHVRLSPALESRLEGLPPTIIVTAGFDLLVDDGAAYAKKLKDEGVPVSYKCFDSMFHGFTGFTQLVPTARQVCEETIEMTLDMYDKTL